MGYSLRMLEVRQTDTYADWFAGLRDRAAKTRIDIRIRRLSLGNPGDVKPVGEGEPPRILRRLLRLRMEPT